MDLKLQNETNQADLMDGIIKQRSQDINDIESLMYNINELAKDIGLEVEKGGEKLERLD